MNRIPSLLVLLAVFLLLVSPSHGAPKSPRPTSQKATAATDAAPPLEMAIGGAGGVYFLAEPGNLTVDVEKCDRNRSRRTELRAVLVGPDRKVLQDVTIPADPPPRGKKFGPPHNARLSTNVQRKGVYALNVTISRDRYGEAIAWGFRTNCPHYLIETSRGHRDARHEEPIVLLQPNRPGDVAFLPRQGAFGMEITNLPADTKGPVVYDDQGKLAATLRVDANGRAAHEFSADRSRGASPWRLHLPAQQATVQIDGVTRWESDDLYPNLSYWTPDASSYFPFPAYRWLVTPYSRLVYGRPEEQAETAFRVQNNSGQKKTIRLAIEFPERPWPAKLSAQSLTLGPKQGSDVLVRYTMPAEGGERVCHVRATPQEDPEFSTYSTLTVRAGTAPATRPLNVPLVLKPYQHENEQFGYLPNYPVESQPYFDLQNRPWVITSRGIETLRDGKWTATALAGAVKSSAARPGRKVPGLASSKVAFDRDGDAYLLAATGGRPTLLHSADGGKTFSACEIPCKDGRRPALDFEDFTGHNTPDGPPPILAYTLTASDPQRIWRRIHDLELYLPKKADGRISIGNPVRLTGLCIGLASHSGIPSGVVSRGTKVHVVWAEATDPETKAPGVPTYVATYDRATNQLGKPALIGYGPPANDIHNSPSITMDSQGYLHVVVGTHGRPFLYARSLKPNDAQAGWTQPMPTGDALSQTYVGLVCGADDSLYLAFRLWQNGKPPFPASSYATLAYQRKRPGQPWEPPRVLIVPPFSEYSVFYHRLTVDRGGRLFLSYDYWSTYWFYRTDHRGSRRALLMSPDAGTTWRLANFGPSTP